MIIYAVELDLDAALRTEYLAWLRDHVQAMLALPGFLDAKILARTEPPPAPGRYVLCVHYQLRDRAAWEGYLTHHAPAMRAAGLARFGTRVAASRRLFESL